MLGIGWYNLKKKCKKIPHRNMRKKSKIYAIATAAAKKWATRRKRWKDPWSSKKPRRLKRKKYSEHVEST